MSKLAGLPRRALFRAADVVVNNDAVVNIDAPMVVNKSRTKDRHDKERRREYMRKYMAAKRAK